MASTAYSTSRQGQQRSDPAEAHYGLARIPDLTRVPSFRFFVVHRGKRTPIRVTSANWDDVNALTSGQVGLTDIALDPDRVTPHNGDQIFCEVNEGGGFGELWRMRVYEPELTVSSESRTVKLINDLELLRRSEGEFHYRRTRVNGKPSGAHPHGWTGPQIINDVCTRYRVKIGALYHSTYRFSGIGWKDKTVSPLEVIRNVILKERRINGRRLVIRYDRGKLYVVPFTRSPGLIALGANLIEAAYQESLAEQFGTAVLVRADWMKTSSTVDAKGHLRKKPEKMFAYVTSPESIAQFGYVRRVFYSPDASTQSELRKEGATWLAAAAKPVRTLTLTHPGIPRLRRGDAIRLGLGQDALRRQIVYVYETHHRINGPGDYTQETTVIFDDPYVDTRGRSILWKLKQTVDEADKAFPKNLAAGNPPKNDQPFPTDNPFGDVGTNGSIPGLVSPPGFGG